MNRLSFPDVNVWLALCSVEHVHGAIARHWWSREPGSIAFTRVTQLSLLRLLTSPVIMKGKPLTNTEAIEIYDHLFLDDRVIFLEELPRMEKQFRETARVPSASPKLWADAWLLAFAQTAGGTLVTFDQALASRSSQCLLLEKERRRP